MTTVHTQVLHSVEYRTAESNTQLAVGGAWTYTSARKPQRSDIDIPQWTRGMMCPAPVHVVFVGQPLLCASWVNSVERRMWIVWGSWTYCEGSSCHSTSVQDFTSTSTLASTCALSSNQCQIASSSHLTSEHWIVVDQDNKFASQLLLWKTWWVQQWYCSSESGRGWLCQIR